MEGNKIQKNQDKIIKKLNEDNKLFKRFLKLEKYINEPYITKNRIKKLELSKDGLINSGIIKNKYNKDDEYFRIIKDVFYYILSKVKNSEEIKEQENKKRMLEIWGPKGVIGFIIIVLSTMLGTAFSEFSWLVIGVISITILILLIIVAVIYYKFLDS